MARGITLLFHQRPMLKLITKLFLQFLSPFRKKVKLRNLETSKDNISISKTIVTNYHKWLNVEDKYSGKIAPHLFPLWSYPDLFKLGKKLNLPLYKVLNQGCRMKINQPLSLNENLNMKIEIYKTQDLASKYRINQRIITGTELYPNALEAEIYAVILKKKASFKEKSKSIDLSRFTFIDDLFVSNKDAKSYAFLSGDINPIHLSKRIAKLMGLKGSIIHGFGLFALVYEKLCAHQFDIEEIDIKFLSPIYLDSKINIYLSSDETNKRTLRVLNENNDIVHLSGEIILK